MSIEIAGLSKDDGSQLLVRYCYLKGNAYSQSRKGPCYLFEFVLVAI